MFLFSGPALGQTTDTLVCTGSYSELRERYAPREPYSSISSSYNDARRAYELAYGKLDRLNYEANVKYVSLKKTTFEEKKFEAKFLAALYAHKRTLETQWYIGLVQRNFLIENNKKNVKPADLSELEAIQQYAHALEKEVISSDINPCSLDISGRTAKDVFKSIIASGVECSLLSEVRSQFIKIELARQAYQSAYDDFHSTERKVTDNTPPAVIAEYEAQRVIVADLGLTLPPLELGYLEAREVYRTGLENFQFCLKNRPTIVVEGLTLEEALQKLIDDGNAFSKSLISLISFDFDTINIPTKINIDLNFDDLQAKIDASFPKINGVSPNRGPLVGGTAITISASNFRSEFIDEINDAGGVLYIGNSPATTFAFVNSTTITAITPSGVLGPANIEFRSNDGKLESNVNFYYTGADGLLVDSLGNVLADQTGLLSTTNPPVLSSISPNSGAISGGTLVTLTGTDFTGDALVLFGTKLATTVTFVNTTTLIAQSPAGDAGSVGVSVFTKNGISNASVEFSYDTELESARNIEKTKTVISDFLHSRRRNLLSNQPKLINFINGTQGNSNGNFGGIGFNGAFGNANLFGGQNSLEFTMSSSFSKVWAEADANEEKALNRYFDGLQRNDDATTFANTPDQNLELNNTDEAELALSSSDVSKAAQKRGYDVWTQMYGSKTEFGANKSSLLVGYLGAHIYLHQDIIVGGLVQFDWSEQKNNTTNNSADGAGWMVGPYIAGKLPQYPLYFEARAAWGKSRNSISPTNTYIDNFNTERWMATAQLSGKFEMKNWTISPAASFSYFDETQESYTDSLSNIIPEQRFSQGEFRLGPNFSRDYLTDNGVRFTPNFGISGVWNFDVNNNSNSAGTTLGLDDARARVDTGLTVSSSEMMQLDFAGFYDGIGASDMSYGASAKLTLQFR